jgi:hypothetical protein
MLEPIHPYFQVPFTAPPDAGDLPVHLWPGLLAARHPGGGERDGAYRQRPPLLLATQAEREVTRG